MRQPLAFAPAVRQGSGEWPSLGLEEEGEPWWVGERNWGTMKVTPPGSPMSTASSPAARHVTTRDASRGVCCVGSDLARLRIVAEEHDGARSASAVHCWELTDEDRGGATVISFHEAAEGRWVPDPTGRSEVLNRRPVVPRVHRADRCEWTPVWSEEGERGDGFVLVAEAADGSVTDVARFEAYDGCVAFCPLTRGRAVGDDEEDVGTGQRRRSRRGLGDDDGGGADGVLVWAADHPQLVRRAAERVRDSRREVYKPLSEVVAGRALPSLCVSVRKHGRDLASDGERRAAEERWQSLCDFLADMREAVTDAVDRHNAAELSERTSAGGTHGEESWARL